MRNWAGLRIVPLGPSFELVRKGVVNLGKWAGGTVAPWDHKMATGLGKEGSFLRLGRGEGAKDCTQVLSRGIPTRFVEVDGLRGIAILLVMLFHFTIITEPITFLDVVVFKVAMYGWSGVNLFFVLSGFLITGILINAKGQAHFFRNFYIRRALRILPLYYALVIQCGTSFDVG